ncbi:hypothetical protein [Thermoplasma acidophilum]|nr:hypothetical protein [Thermoplasma acidophilum]MCY0851588.1 hypothetical protein [Thermoplasma acidophilum]
MNLSSPGHISVSRIIGIIVGWLMLIFLYSAYADNTNRNYSIAMWFIYFIFLTWSIISLILIYRTLTGGNALSGPSNFQAEKYMPDYAGYTMNRKFGLVLLGIAVVTIITGTFLSLAIEGYSLSLSAYYYSSQIQYASVAMFIVLSHAGIIIYSLNKKKFNNMVGFGNTESPSAK